ncbi:class I SAM-dependent DNA methyltransferase [Streptomyces sulphureus]|uniref:class I SAM-dependent DNA methyltransferase n=1 Tax=Streptomyces sulphureus TaxID=47758 RepID=UPI00035F3489|nr:methyltransferase domain-containing protein [Streptomyces sulphureus]
MAKSQESVQQAHRLEGDVGRIAEYYGDWAASYDADLSESGYQGPRNIGELYAALTGSYRWLQREGTTVLDAGCGTGLAGVVLREKGATVDGFDLSGAMVEQARTTGAYRALAGGVDLNAGLVEYEDNSYDVTASCGVFTLGHVSPEGLRSLLRVTAPGGLVLVSTFRDYLDGTDFVAVTERLAAEGELQVVERRRDLAYTSEGPADYWAFEVLR